MKSFYVTIMSEDPNDAYGIEQGDNHQKYGFSVQARDKDHAADVGVEQFKSQCGDLPIYWVKVSED